MSILLLQTPAALILILGECLQSNLAPTTVNYTRAQLPRHTIALGFVSLGSFLIHVSL
jgi:hypothetical protein